MRSDVCLILEGTYPYVAGGVSSWVHDLIQQFRHMTFSILYLGPYRSAHRQLHYQIPHNVIEFRELYLFDYQVKREKTARGKKKDFERLRMVFKDMKRGKTESFFQLMDFMGDSNERTISLYDLAHTQEGWQLLRSMYDEEGEDLSFIDYFWTWRFLYLPLLSLLRAPIPEAQVYHAVSTGYAGLLATMAKRRFNRPLLLTEHGIYTRERKIEISKADWIYSEAAKDIKVVAGEDFFRRWWIQLFSFLSHLVYQNADQVITLYEGNRQIEIEEGLSPDKVRIIPNGVDIHGLRSLPREPSPRGVWRVGFVGRIVPIKDVKTFLKACRKIIDEIKTVEIYLLGPTDEDPGYYEECRFLVEIEALGPYVHFMGKVNLLEYYPRLDVVVLTSISEAQPIVLLEAGACGIPCVATDVGACSELLYGRTEEDRMLGASGIITPIYNPEATALAVIRILRDGSLYQRMARVGQTRIQMYYQREDMMAQYHTLYSRFIEQKNWDESFQEKEVRGHGRHRV